MFEKETRVEKRKHTRFKDQKNINIALENDFTTVGQMINISKGGLAFSYIGKEEQITGWHKIYIFLNRKRFYLKELPFKAIWDFYIDTKVPFSTLLMKQCGGQFGELTNEQFSQLDYFIAHLTNG